MRILIVTPLYPPDIASHAPYVKEFASRMRSTHTVTILTYNHIPERIEGVRIIAISKRMPVLFRTIRFWYALWREAKKHDVLYIQNGPSVELPYIFLPSVGNLKTVYRLGDEVALCKATESLLRRTLLRLSCLRAHVCITHPDSSYDALLTPALSTKEMSCVRPHARPEILPFTEHDPSLFGAYTTSWSDHVHCLERIFTTS